LIKKGNNVRNNDVLRRLRYVFDLSDSQMMTVFQKGGRQVTRAEVSAWLKKDADPEIEKCKDASLASFLNGFICEKRGPKDGAAPAAESYLSNNQILRKLKIALDLKDDDLLQILALAELQLSRHELSAFFRKKGHKNYRVCKDQVLRNFLSGLQVQYRGETLAQSDFVWKD
jgi:uncharacterized protein YehS (DUF1456 family)